VTEDQGKSSSPRRRRKRRRGSLPAAREDLHAQEPVKTSGSNDRNDGEEPAPTSVRPRRRRNSELVKLEEQQQQHTAKADARREPRPAKKSGAKKARRPNEEKVKQSSEAFSGIIEIRKDGTGFLRQPKFDLKAKDSDPMLPKELVRRFALKNGSMLECAGFSGSGHNSARINKVSTIDGQSPSDYRRNKSFKKRVVIDPDFHYELGLHPQEGQLSMRVVDLLCPIGRGQRALLVAPPRTGKTTIMMNIASAMEALYPDVHLIVLLIDERPEEATYWRRNITNGEVFVSTMDQSPSNHTRLSELVQFRAERLVESGKEVVILLDSLTRMTRAFNNTIGGNNSRTMSGGLDSRVFQNPKHFFGAARNTESGSSLTVIATALIDTGSKMDQVIFEEFKGTGNLELTLDRHLADRRIFPAVRIEATATRKEEKLLSSSTMRKVNILRRVLSRLRPREAMEMLADRLSRYESNKDFLDAFSSDDV
jgi:transcription termination factor Rho